jgi:hypothetical protein
LRSEKLGLFPRRPASQVQPGDRFIKTSDPYGKVWEVIALVVAVDGILHARLRRGEGQGDLITIGAGVLLDQRLWQPVRKAP